MLKPEAESTGEEKPKIILAQDINYPPYAFLADPETPNDDFELAGLIVDITNGMNKTCPYEVVHVQTDWDSCWFNNAIGVDLKNEVFDGCMSYTHTKGVRNRYLDFTHAVTSKGAAGLLVRLTNGKPEVDPADDLTNVNVVDVTGWAPTIDGLLYVSNDCTGEPFNLQVENQYHTSEHETYPWYGKLNNGTADVELELTNSNDIAVAMLLDPKSPVEAVWIYADQAKNYKCTEED